MIKTNLQTNRETSFQHIVCPNFFHLNLKLLKEHVSLIISKFF